MGLDDIHDNCGVALVNIPDGHPEEGNVVKYLYKLLLNMQGRGQLSAGITTYNPKRTQLIDTYKDLGMVNEVFKTSFPLLSARIFKRYAANKGIGHVRYATCGKDDKSFAQPFERHHGRKWKWFSFGFNGNIANFSELREKLLKKSDYHLVQNVDTEIIMHYLSRELGKHSRAPDLVEVFRNLADVFDGSWSLTYLNARGEMVAARDPSGIRPLVYGEKDGITFVASESNALSNVGVKTIKTVPPGCMLYINGKKPRICRFARAKPAHCMFEWVYFASVSSVMEEKSVYLVRERLGKELAKQETLKLDKDTLVIPVPDSAKPAGDAYAYALGLPSVEGLIRNRYVGRTFIEGRGRFEKVKNKFAVLREVVKDKRIIIVDDSVVRGTTTKNIVKYLKEEGEAKEVHVRVSCPPIIAPCFYGIDMSTVSELFARKFSDRLGMNALPQETLRTMAKDIGADSLRYQTVSGLVKAIGLPKNDLCLACVTGKYPTPWGKKLHRLAEKRRGKGSVDRTSRDTSC